MCRLDGRLCSGQTRTTQSLGGGFCCGLLLGPDCEVEVNITEIAKRVKLCTLTMSAWRATKLNPGESKKVNFANHTDKAAKVMVLLTDHEALVKLRKCHMDAYVEHRRLTLPSVQDGMRLLPIGREIEHTETMKEHGQIHEQLVREFLDAYQTIRAEAPARLNGLYVSSQWPAADKLREKFAFSTRYLGCPTDGSWGDWFIESTRAAEDELKERVTGTLQHIVDRCKADGKLYQSVFDNLNDLVGLLPDLNISGSDPYAALMAGVQTAGLSTVDADNLREDQAARQSVAAQAENILKAFNGVKL
jgi:hypothetical protein